MKIRLIGALSAFAVLLGALWFRQEKKQTVQDAVISSLTLPSQDNEKIVVDPNTHKIQITTSKGTTTEFLPDRPSEIEVRKDGNVVVTAKQLGVEHEPFAGVGFGNTDLRFFVGVDLLYYRRVDVGVFVSDRTNLLTSVRIGLDLSYMVWHDVRLSVGVDNAGTPNVLISERF